MRTCTLPYRRAEKDTVRYKSLFRTRLGALYVGRSEEVLSQRRIRGLYGKIQLILTSPPFPLNRKKRYGNKEGEEYVEWLASFAPLFRKLLKPNGSIVIEMGNGWVPGRPVQSTLALQALLRFMEHPQAKFRLCQEFICFNPAKLPTPAQWVTIERVRVKDAFTRLWWMAATDRPKADNRRVLRPYSRSMEELLTRGTYNAGLRPSEHQIDSASFLRNNGGAIPPNVLLISNTGSIDPYLTFCKANHIRPHPARMPLKLAEFFINFLTEPRDIVLDPFAGSNVTGAVAEKLCRRWVSIEAEESYAKASLARFTARLRGQKTNKSWSNI